MIIEIISDSVHDRHSWAPVRRMRKGHANCDMLFMRGVRGLRSSSTQTGPPDPARPQHAQVGWDEAPLGLDLQ